MEVINNKKEFRFETPMPDGEFARLDYRWLKGSLVIMHTIVPESGRGKGIGATLVKYVLEYARANNLKVIIYCSFAVKYAKEHPEYNDVLLATLKD